jgi:hypothetical protein
MPSSPPTLPSFCLYSYASCLPRLVVVLPLVLHHLCFLSRHCLPSGSASTCPLLVALPPLIVPLFFSGMLASCPPWLCVVSSLVTLLPSVCLRLHLSLHHRLSSRPSHVSCVSLVQLVVVLPLITPTPPVCWRLQLLWCHCLWCAPLVPLFHSGWLSCSLSS